jgi:hypothetical protein
MATSCHFEKNMNWYDYPVAVPPCNPHYDVGLGGSHDMTYATPPNTEIFQIASGIITDISEPSWGKQVTIELDEPVNGHKYFAILHLSAVNPSLRVGQHMSPGEIVGWSGGCVNSAQYNGTHNPTGQNFLNNPTMSSQPQVGIALCDGRAYRGLGWKTFPPIDMSLNPEPIVQNYKNNHASPPPINHRSKQWEDVWNSNACNVPDTTGIAVTCKREFEAHKMPAVYPIQAEIKTTDWNGKNIQWQSLSNGYHSEYYLENNIGYVYDEKGNKL